MTDYHMHTTYCDGKNTAEEMVLSAIEKGLTSIGFSGHGFTDYDDSYCMQKDTELKYRAEILRLREKYKDKIEILLGIEQDLWAGKPDPGLDFVIGSVHYFTDGKQYFPVDHTADVQKEAADKLFGGDFYALAEHYYDAVSKIPEMTGADVVGHFDLITKFIEKNPMFDTNHPRYVAAWKKAADKLLASGILFEMNTGAITRGYRTTPYPADPIFDYLLEHGAKFIINSDSHRTDSIGYRYDEYVTYFEKRGRMDALLPKLNARS